MQFFIDKYYRHDTCELYNMHNCNIEQQIGGAYYDFNSVRYHGVFSDFSESGTCSEGISAILQKVVLLLLGFLPQISLSDVKT